MEVPASTIEQAFAEAVAANQTVAIFRLPKKGGTPVFSSQRKDGNAIFFAGTPKTFESVPAALNSYETQFIFAPFSPSKKTPILALEPTQVFEFFPEEIRDFKLNLLRGNAENVEIAFKNYEQQFEKFAEILSSRKAQKIVLARRERDFCDNFSPLAIFRRAALKNPDAFVYLFHSPLAGTWLGASPELLFFRNECYAQTVALAGTRKPGESWDAKNLAEQKFVADFVREQISAAGAQIWSEAEGTRTLAAGTLEHLQTIFQFKMDFSQIPEFVAALHPTPAVAGTPRDFARDFILQNEAFPRDYYSGFLGILSPYATNFFVNIRCFRAKGVPVVGTANLRNCEIDFFAGGGLLPDSVPADEFAETEAKIATMKSLFD